VGDGAGGDEVPTVPVEHLGVVGGQRVLAFPGAGQPGFAAGMTELDGGGGALGLDEVGDALQAGDEVVFPQAQVADGAAASAFYFGGFDHYQAAAAGGVFAGVHQVPVGGEAFFRGILVHWGEDDPVAQGDASYLQRGEQQWFGHGA
jgi:hypothetical protein